MPKSAEVVAAERVQDVYTERVRQWGEKDRRDHWRYVASKMQSDYALLEGIDLRKASVLNIGCNFPLDELHFARRVGSWTAIDLNQSALDAAREMVDRELAPELASRVHFRREDATRLSFEAGTFDVVVAFSTIDHIPSHQGRQAAIDEMSRVVRPGGKVVVTVPNVFDVLFLYYNWRYGEDDYGFAHCFSPVEIYRMVRRAGLRPLRFDSDKRWFDSNRVTRPLYQYFFRFLGSRMGILAEKPA